jgi:hypothetical protein
LWTIPFSKILNNSASFLITIIFKLSNNSGYGFTLLQISYQYFICRYASYGSEEDKWEPIESLEENGLGQEVKWFCENFLTHFKDFEINREGTLFLAAPPVPLLSSYPVVKKGKDEIKTSKFYISSSPSYPS